jgi:hypothetical protein
MPTLKLPDGYSINADIVSCCVCQRKWHIPAAMFVVQVLSPNAWQVLVEHRDLHSPSSSPFLGARPQVVVTRPYVRRKPRLDRKRR